MGGRATWQLKLKVFRKSTFYMTNVVAMVGCIATLTFLVFLFTPEQWEQRATYSVTLVLTSVAFKFVLANTLPKVSFMTLLDIYLVASFILMFAAILESGVVCLLHQLHQSDWLEIFSVHDLFYIDLACAGVLLFVWVFWNICYAYRFYQLTSKQ